MPLIIDDAPKTKQKLTLLLGTYRLTVGLMLILGVVNLTISAQATPTITPDEAQTVMLSPDGMVMLRYSAPQAQWISLTADAVSTQDEFPLDTVLIVRDADHNVLAYVDDTPVIGADNTLIWDTNASIEALYLPHAGDYWVLVDSFNGLSTGEALVNLRVIDPFNLEETTEGTITRLTFTLPPATSYERPITLIAGEALMVTVRDLSGGLDAMLMLYDAEGTLLATYDDHDSDDFRLDDLDVRGYFEAQSDIIVTLVTRDFIGRTGDLEMLISILE